MPSSNERKQQRALADGLYWPVKDRKLLTSELSGLKTPRILFFGLGSDAQRRRMFFEKGILNRKGTIIRFVQNRHEAAFVHGLEVLQRELVEQDPIELAKRQLWEIREQERYLLILFPHETTNLVRWIRDSRAYQYFDIGGTFATNQEIRREQVLIVGSWEVANDKKNIMAAQYGSDTKPPELPPEKQTRATIVAMFGLREEAQQGRFEDLRYRSRLLEEINVLKAMAR